MKRKPQQLPPGEYDCKSLDIEFFIDEKGRKRVTWKLEVTGGPEDGAYIEKQYYITSAQAVGFLKMEFALIGVHIRSGKDIENLRSDIFGKLVRLESRINDKGYSSYNLKGYAKDAAVEDPPFSDEALWGDSLLS